MSEDLMRYDLLAQEALRGVVRAALKRVVKSGLPGDHHFYIAFETDRPGVLLSERILKKYPREMTIVLQHQFGNLAVREEDFEVELWFDNVPERLVIPFGAIKGFLDPHVQFGLQFETAGEARSPGQFGKKAAETLPAPVEAPPIPEAIKGDTEPPLEEKSKVVSLDSFRKKS